MMISQNEIDELLSNLNENEMGIKAQHGTDVTIINYKCGDCFHEEVCDYKYDVLKASNRVKESFDDDPFNSKVVMNIDVRCELYFHQNK